MLPAMFYLHARDSDCLMFNCLSLCGPGQAYLHGTLKMPNQKMQDWKMQDME